VDGGNGIHGASVGIVELSGCGDRICRDAGSVCGDVWDQCGGDVAIGGGGGESIGERRESESGEFELDGIDRDGRNDQRVPGGTVPGGGMHGIHADRDDDRANV
jgi:hypothetical protein